MDKFDMNDNEWMYYTKIKPQHKQMRDSQLRYFDEYNKAFNLFLEECKFDMDVIEPKIQQDKVFTIFIDTSDDKDKIDTSTSYHITFLRSKFLFNPKFKRYLIEYYNPLGYFVNGPFLFSEDKWMIEIVHKLKNA